MAKEFTLEGEIGWAIGTWDVKNILRQAGGDDFKLNFASVGGSVVTGLKIFNLLKRYKGKVDIHLIGEAMSMGSYIALSASGKITAEPNSVFMIHNARSFVSGDHNAMRKRAEITEGLSKLLRNEYVNRTGKSKEEIEGLMNDETFFFGKGLVEAGFVDEIMGEEDSDPDAKETHIAVAKESFEACMHKLSSEKPDDYEQAAAIMPDFTAKKLDNVEKNVDNARNKEHININPADAENKKLEGSMDLREAIEKFPAIDAQVKIKVQEAVAAAEAKLNEENAKIIAKVSVVFDENKTYPAIVMAKAKEVLEGKSDVSVVESMIGMHDMHVEKEKSTAAAKETKAQGETHTEKETGAKNDGLAKTPEDVVALSKLDRGEA